MDSKEILEKLRTGDKSAIEAFKERLKIWNNEAPRELQKRIEVESNSRRILWLDNISKEITDDLDYAVKKYGSNHALIELFIYFTLIAYGRLSSPNIIDAKRLPRVLEKYTNKERTSLQIFTPQEILYELHELLLDLGCDEKLSRYLQDIIRGKTGGRLPKKPILISKEEIELGAFILENKSEPSIDILKDFDENKILGK